MVQIQQALGAKPATSKAAKGSNYTPALTEWLVRTLLLVSAAHSDGKLPGGRIVQATIKAVRKYEKLINFPETHKLWIDANLAPALRGTDDAIWRRILPIPCKHKSRHFVEIP